MKVVILGLSITSSWGNGHATTYRGLVREMAARGHDIVFLERDVQWYASHRDDPQPAGCTVELYKDRITLFRHHGDLIRTADVVIVGSFVPEGIFVGELVRTIATGLVMFYDIDTPVTVASLERGACNYLTKELIKCYDVYLSFTGGRMLERLSQDFGSPCAHALFCSVDVENYRPLRETETRWDLGYLGTYSDDRQPGLEELLLKPSRRLPARQFVVAGPQYPESIVWPANVERLEHVGPPDHSRFYNSQSFTLNLTRADMKHVGWSPSIRLFEAAACGSAIISDRWDGLEELFVPGEEIFLVESAEEVVDLLVGTSRDERERVGENARRRVLEAHTAAHRASELESIILEQRSRVTSTV